ncbi:MAG: undecaprenyldiphospho-muramoylpentapeptide beta-N-acetylglucosaminyltransferase [Ruminococcaceae bacterium]|nr:undecaprenyldiphospho-muramoylpentapeptide beta-N-acetylglucosaminyltransferase [Oscillospiraceae bacterium]
MKVIISGGGTAGHINPGLAIASHLSAEHQADILFIGTEKGMENRLIPKAGWPIKHIEVSGLIRKLTFKNFTVIKQFITAISKAKKIIKEFQPDVVIGTGGYVCAPVLFAAHSLKIPTLIHEQNVIPGVTVKLAAKFSDCICISFADTTKFLKPAYAEKCVLTGNPIRGEMLEGNYIEARKQLGLDDRPFVVAFGGSLGAARLNDAVIDFLNTEKTNGFQFMLGTGQRYYDEVKEKIKTNNPSVYIEPYINQMDLVMTAADLVIGRSGALTISELCALGKPSILIPSPNVAHDHQTVNAKSMENAGCSVMIPDSELTGKRLYDAITEIIGDSDRMSVMAGKAKTIAITNGAERICDEAIARIKKK